MSLNFSKLTLFVAFAAGARELSSAASSHLLFPMELWKPALPARSRGRLRWEVIRQAHAFAVRREGNFKMDFNYKSRFSAAKRIPGMSFAVSNTFLMSINNYYKSQKNQKHIYKIN